MEQEHKKLLLKDLCGRLPYGVKISVNDNVETLQGINTLDNVVEYGSFLSSDIEEVKPYLFPLSSINEEQYNEFFTYYHGVEMEEVRTSGDYLKATYLGENAKREWLDKNHFDYHYLIPMDLAIDATGKNIY